MNFRKPSGAQSGSFLKIVFISGLLLFISGMAVSQQTVTSATLSGRIEDANGAGLSGASLTATNLETNQKQTATTGSDGRYRFPYLQVGSYRITIEAQGFSPLTKELTVTVGQALDLPIKLEVAGVSAQVNIASDVPMIETVRTQITETIRPTDINKLPLNGRNYLDLALLVPAVSPTNTGSNQRFAETSAIPGQGISIAGQRNLYNSFVVDGLSANDDAADLTGTYYSEEVVNQFQVITSGGIAEFGRASGGVVNIVTKSGTNDWRGNLYGFARNQRFDARNPLAPTKDLLTQAQYGGTIGGPIKRNRTFFFTNFEQTRRNYSAVITIAPSAVTTINNRLNAVNYNGPRVSTGVVPASFDTTNFFGRIDHKLNDRNQLSARYSLYHITAVNSRTVGGLNAVSRGSGLDDTDQTVEASNITTINSRTLNEARFQFTHSKLEAPINDSIGPAVGISGVANFGTATSSPLARDIDLFEAVDNISTQRGAHSPKVGVDFLYNRVNIAFPGAIQGVYNFTSMNNFLTGNYSTFQQAFGAPSQFQSNPNVGFFGQDEWRVRSNLTINAGLRYDLQFLPSPIQTDTNNLAPRVGFAFAPGSRKTVIRASFGLYYDRLPLRATSNALQRDGTKYIVVQFSPTQAGAPVFPNVLATQPSVLLTKPNITRIDPHIETSYSEQANVQVERELPGDTLISVGYLHLHGLHIIASRNVNVPTAPASAGIPNLGRPDPNWGNIGRFEGSGVSFYDGMVVSFNKRAANWANVRVSYTLSKTTDDAGNFFFSTPQDNFNLRGDMGLSDNDQRHRLVVSGWFQAPDQKRTGWQKALRGFQLSYIFTYASRLPFNILLGSDRNFDTNNNDRPVGVGRNTGQGFDFASLDMRLSRRFRITERLGLDVLAEGFNLLNRSNFGVPNNTFGPGPTPNATFGQPTQAFDPRQFQFGLKLSF
ncbi:MAG TPA: carboxypeptidase regulatory-like domain-containing protein [Pyrinomonadaceae bacterium]|nr:carboxypeptidase regulatory-like domain-containing protein [Pyrinomonadaceae bacterium]